MMNDECDSYSSLSTHYSLNRIVADEWSVARKA